MQRFTSTYVNEELDLCSTTIIPRIYFRIEEELNMRKVEHDRVAKKIKLVKLFMTVTNLLHELFHMIFIP